MLEAKSKASAIKQMYDRVLSEANAEKAALSKQMAKLSQKLEVSVDVKLSGRFSHSGHCHETPSPIEMSGIPQPLFCVPTRFRRTIACPLLLPFETWQICRR